MTDNTAAPPLELRNPPLEPNEDRDLEELLLALRCPQPLELFDLLSVEAKEGELLVFNT